MSFGPEQVYCVLDYETFSHADLKRTGSYEYSAHESTDILCAAWCVGTRAELRQKPIEWWAPGLKDGGNFAAFYQALMNPAIILVAHNALFEQVITKNVFATKHMYSKAGVIQNNLPPSRWLCTASLAAALALPRNLEGAASALSLPVQKDMEGRRLMLKWCKPRKPTKGNPGLRHDDQAELQRLVEYCKKDVATEIELFLTARPLSNTERKVWEFDQKLNLRGFLIDRPLVTTILDMIDAEVEHINAETAKLTGGFVRSATQAAKVLQWLKEHEGVFLPDLTIQTVKDALANELVTGDGAKLLRYRQSISKSSTAKYEAFEKRSRTDGRVRDIVVYHTASTGRWGGAGVQPQNFPRGTIKNTLDAIEDIRSGDVEYLRMVYGDLMSLFSSCLRNMIIAPKGRTFDVADYAAIEVRVLFWLAGDVEGVEAFEQGRDLYKELAVDIFRGVALAEVSGDQRFLGKTATLGCGFQMGKKRFRESCAEQGKKITEELAEAAVSSYRARHRPVVAFWKNVEYAAIAAAESPGKTFTVENEEYPEATIAWQRRGAFLLCQLPSGRLLSYKDPTVRQEPTAWGEVRPKLYHWGVDAVTKKWVNGSTFGGKLTENVVQAIARDLMAGAMLRVENSGWEIVLTVHDELIGEIPVSSHHTNADFCRLMEVVPPWAKGCPIKAEGWRGVRYRK